VEEINAQRLYHFVNNIRQALEVSRGKTVGILGLAFKANTDDTRGAPSLPIIERLLADGIELRLYDPHAMPSLQLVFREEKGRVHYCTSAYDAARGADALLLLTDWEEFRQLDLARLSSEMQNPVLLDGRNLYDPCEVRAAGFDYISIGRKACQKLEKLAVDVSG
jgi:UDPglucose 6-dehydrogenase